MNDKEMLQARQAYYQFFSRVFERELDDVMLTQLAAVKLVNESGNTAVDEGTRQIELFFSNTPESVSDELAADFASVFLAAGKAKGRAAFPYESVYTSKEKAMMQDAWEKMAGLYREKGMELKNVGAEIKEDHISAQLLYAAHLVKTSADAELSDFIQEHLLNWVPEFVQDIDAVASYDLYKGLGKMLLGFLNEEKDFLDAAVKEVMETQEEINSYALDIDELDAVLESWKSQYHVYAPRIVAKRSGSKQTVRYQEISSVKDIYNEGNSDFSPKEVYYPISQTMYYFTEKEVRASQLTDDKGIILIMHPCDINAMRRLDNIFLKNGGEDNADLFYARLRDKVRIVMLECRQSGDNCFCVSMNSNITSDYDIALRLEADCAKVQVKNNSWNQYFKEHEKTEYAPSFVMENRKKTKLPVIDGIEDVRLASALDYWTKFDEKCIGCGGCNTVCPTCSCFDTVDIVYDETSPDGERRRVWSSCMLDSFTMTAGGARARKTPGENMRFRVMHKVYDYQKRFKTEENMCVGCGRCITRCPKEIDFADTLNGFAQALCESKKGGK